jgi:hypothetical protein
MRTVLWIVFFVVIAVMCQQEHVLASRSGHGTQGLEFVNANAGKAIVCGWQRICYGRETLVNVARSITRLDFLFILTYVCLMIACSYNQMQRERWVFWNELLRLNLILALLAGLLDVTENFILLYDLRHVYDPGLYYSTFYVSLLKWILSGWVILVWGISVIRSGLGSKRGYTLSPA